MKKPTLKIRRILKIINKISQKFIPLNLHTKIYILFLLYFNKIKVEEIRKKTGLDHLKLKDLKKYKKSDKIFILGSGASINKINKNEWGEILKYDTIGFNFWLYHDIKPKFYCYEENIDKNRNKIFYELLEIKKEIYRDVIFIVKDLEYKGITHSLIPSILKKRMFLSSELSVPYSLKKEIEYFFKICRKKEILIKKNGSLSYLIVLLYYLGYKEIILCGIDLDDNDYFYFHKKYKKYPQLKNSLNIQKPHLTEEGEIKMSEVLKILKEQMTEISIKIYSETGKLKNDFEIYKK